MGVGFAGVRWTWVVEMKSLAEHLGIAQDKTELDVVDDFSETMSIEEFCRGILTSRAYRESLRRRILMDELSPAIELMLYDRAHGCRTKNLKIEHSDRPFQGWNDAQLAERELALVRHLRQLRTNGTGAASDEEDASPPTSVH